MQLLHALYGRKRDFGVDQQNELYITDLTGAVYRFVVEPPNDIDAPGGNPSTFSLDQNYASPFNPTTTIRYTLARAVRVKLEVFKLLGQCGALLAEGVPRPGHTQLHRMLRNGRVMSIFTA